MSSPTAAALQWPPEYDRNYRPAATEKYWDRARETMSADERIALALAAAQRRVAWAYERAPFYRTRWDAVGFKPGDLRTMDDFAKLPTIKKADLRADQAENPPFGSYVCVDRSEIAHIHGTREPAGGRRVRVEHRRMARIAEAHARIVELRDPAHDTVFIGSILSLYVGSWARYRYRAVARWPSVRRGRGRSNAAGSELDRADATDRILRHAVLRCAWPRLRRRPRSTPRRWGSASCFLR